jgi:16S rRNA (cytosine967-C5)-methyltransferase
MRSFSYINTATGIIRNYDGKMPFALWLKEFFKAHKKAGSNDRKQISHACYCYFRLGNAFRDLEINERLLTAIFLASNTPNRILEEQRPEWNEKIQWRVEQKLELLGAAHEAEKIFPYAEELSASISLFPFSISHLVQPDLFLRIRPGKEQKVTAALSQAGISSCSLPGGAVAMGNSTKIEEAIRPDADAVIQDLHSQRVLDPLVEVIKKEVVFETWDCCAASGGKSILLHDLFPAARLTVSDVRSSILQNLENRFHRAGINRYRSCVSDVSKEGHEPPGSFDAVICDAPCSGSGTWGRTPEQLVFFTEEKIAHYVSLQKNISTNAAKALKKNGYFLYITCSVFRRENEEVVDHLVREAGLELRSMKYYHDPASRADTLFSALFYRS